MIDKLYRDIEAATIPSRELDCLLHEIILGHICQCIDRIVQDANHKRGSMLIEGGGQLLWRDVPRYTENADEAMLLFGPSQVIRISQQTPDIIEAARGFGEEHMAKKWTVSMSAAPAWEALALTSHNASIALALCTLAVRAAMGPQADSDLLDMVINRMGKSFG